MIVTRLSLTDFRNYAAAELTLYPGSNLFVGSNGQGKTNLVEAVGFLSTLGSHRVSSDHALIRQGTDAAVIRAYLRHDEREVLAEVQINRAVPNRAQLNRSPIKVRELPRYFSSVLFAPEDLSLVRGDPAGRRRFLDELLVLLAPRFSGVFSDYDRVLRQRNSLLKSARFSTAKGGPLSTLEIWDERLIAYGSEIIAARSEVVARLRPAMSSAYVSVAGSDHQTTISSLSSTGPRRTDPRSDLPVPEEQPISVAEAAEGIRGALSGVRRAELERGITLVGPHRDDVFLGLNGMPARGYASHGESWSFALALKLASAVVLQRDSPLGDPVLVLDDVFAELDESRRTHLARAVAGFDQVLITAAVLDDVPAELNHHTVEIRGGRIVEPAQ